MVTTSSEDTPSIGPTAEMDDDYWASFELLKLNRQPASYDNGRAGPLQIAMRDIAETEKRCRR